MAEKAEELKTQEDKLAQAKELYSRGSRNYLVKSYSEAADDLSQVCALYEEIYGPLCDELGMPYLLYAKSLLALGLEENKVIDVPDEEDDDDDAEEEGGGSEENGENKESVDGIMPTIAEGIEDEDMEKENGVKDEKTKKEEEPKKVETPEKNDIDPKTEAATVEKPEPKPEEKEKEEPKPGTSNGQTEGEDTNEDGEDDNEPATNLQVAWETLELAAKIFEKQGESALPNLAEVRTELGNIQFENSVLDAAREDYNSALKIYKQLPISNYRRAMAEINYKIGLTYLMQEEQSQKESVESYKKACELLDDEIKEIKAKPGLTDEDKLKIEDMEETRQEILVKITEIEETRQQCLDEVRAALDNYKSPSKDPEIAGPSTSAAVAKPVNDISHLIKRKKPDTTTDAETTASPAKRPAL